MRMLYIIFVLSVFHSFFAWLLNHWKTGKLSYHLLKLFLCALSFCCFILKGDSTHRNKSIWEEKQKNRKSSISFHNWSRKIHNCWSLLGNGKGILDNGCVCCGCNWHQAKTWQGVFQITYSFTHSLINSLTLNQSLNHSHILSCCHSLFWKFFLFPHFLVKHFQERGNSMTSEMSSIIDMKKYIEIEPKILFIKMFSVLFPSNCAIVCSKISSFPSNFCAVWEAVWGLILERILYE